MLEIFESRRFRYALAALIAIASSPGPLSTRRLTEQLGCPKRYLEADLQAFAQAGILESRRGKSGGYLLACNPARVSLALLIRCMGHEKRTLPGDSPIIERVIEPTLEDARTRLASVLEKVTLAELLSRSEQMGLIQRSSPPQDFCI